MLVLFGNGRSMMFPVTQDSVVVAMGFSGSLPLPVPVLVWNVFFFSLRNQKQRTTGCW